MTAHISTPQQRVPEPPEQTPQDSMARAAELAAIERELRCTPQHDQQHVSHQDSDRILAELHEFVRLCQRLQLPDASAAACGLAGDVLARTASARENDYGVIADSGSADECFAALLQTTTLELEAIRHSEGETPGGVALARMRERLRDALRRRLSEQPPDVATYRRWTTALLDRADLVLTSVEEVRPGQGADQLLLVAEELTWFSRNARLPRESQRKLKRKISKLRAERQERRLQARLEQRFGRRAVARSERLILLLIGLVLALMVAEFAIFGSNVEHLAIPRDGLSTDVGAEATGLRRNLYYAFCIIDGVICAVFLSEFFVRLWYVPGKLFWFRRHLLVDFIPSIPFGLLMISTPAAVWAYWADLFRFLRLARVVRFLRLARALGLLARGFDRLARQYGHVLNQNIILYPNREEWRAALAAQRETRDEPARFQSALRHDWKRLLTTSPPELRPEIARLRLSALEPATRQVSLTDSTDRQVQPFRTREIPLALLIDQLQSLTPQAAESSLGEDLVTQSAAFVRTLARPPLRWLPIIHSLIPKVTPDMTDGEVVSSASRRLSNVLRRLHDTWFWFSDLYGTVTPSQFVDRVGTILVKGSFRPAYRLALLGGLLLLAQLLLWLTSIFAGLQHFLSRFLGPVVVVMGSISFILLAIGLWLKRIAREATEFYERSAQAQFLALTEMIRSRYLQRDAEILYDRVLRPDWIQREQRHLADAIDPTAQRQRHLDTLNRRIEETLLKAHAGHDGSLTFQGLENALLLYRDWLDGALLADSDTRTTNQLLGNPSIRQFVRLSARLGPREIKALHRLDLERQRSLFGGPYLWFNLITRSITHSVACLLVDYNQNAIPLSELALIGNNERRGYDTWLAGQHVLSTSGERATRRAAERRYVTTAFTALHFLDFDPQRDEQIEQRFGTAVLAKLRSDRARMIRQIFGTYPLHDRPKEQRVVNLYSLYGGWLAGGRAYAIPLFVAGALARFTANLCRWIARSVSELRHFELRIRSEDAARAHFLTAIRKIDRIRRPVVDAAIRLRMKLDPEFLGVPLPGEADSSIAGCDVEADLRFLRPDADFTGEIERERRRAEADMRRLSALIDDGLFDRLARSRNLPPETFYTPSHTRAAAAAYLADLCGVRQLLSARDILDEVYTLAATEVAPTPARWPRPRLRRRFKRYWKEHGSDTPRARDTAWSATVRNVWGAADALHALHDHGESGPAEGERRLAELLLHPGRITEQLVTLRTIQTLAVLDVLNYREHVYRLGRYVEMGDTADELLEWKTTGGSRPVNLERPVCAQPDHVTGTSAP